MDSRTMSSIRQLRPHFCHAKGCTVPVDPSLLMCRGHWLMVPVSVRTKVLSLYRPGQEVDKHPSMEYLAAAEEAIEWVHELEERLGGLPCG